MSLDGKSLHVLTPMYGGISMHTYFTSFYQLTSKSQAMKFNCVHYKALPTLYDRAIESAATGINAPPAPALRLLPKSIAISVVVGTNH